MRVSTRQRSTAPTSLTQVMHHISVSAMHAEEVDFSSSLEKRLREVSKDSSAVSPSADKAVDRDASEGPVDYNDPSRDSFSDAGDSDIAKALASRLEGGTSSSDETTPEVVAAAPAEDEYLEGANPLLVGVQKTWIIPLPCVFSVL